jgi:hypothetical protein
MKKLMHFVAALSKISAAIWHFGGVELKMDKLLELSSPYTMFSTRQLSRTESCTLCLATSIISLYLESEINYWIQKNR